MEEKLLNTKHTSRLGPIKRIFIIILLAVFGMLMLFAVLQYHNNKNENVDKRIINAFGKQRMYTQQISKDASRLYALMQARDSGKIYESKSEINAKVQSVKSTLNQTRQDFSDTLSSMHRGYIYVDSYEIDIEKPLKKAAVYLEQIDVIWVQFEEAIDILLEAKALNGETAAAAININENNMELLGLCDSVLVLVLEDSIQDSNQMGVLFYCLIGLFSLVIIFALYQLLKFIIIPFNQLYQGISEIGLDNYPLKAHFPTQKKVAPIVGEISDAFKKINDLIRLIENITNNDSFMDILNFINHTFSSFIPYNYIGIALIDDEKKLLRASYGVSDGSIVGLTERIMGASWLIKDTSLGELLHTGKARILNDLEEYTAGKPLKPYNKILLEAGIRSSITLPLIVSGEPVGIIFFSSATKNVYSNEHLKILKTLVNSIAISLNQNIFINDLLYSSILALAKLAETRDEDTGEHLDRMRKYTRKIAELLYENESFSDQITLEFIDRLERFSPLHDIGKVAIRDGILLKPARLTPEEFEEMKRHTSYGAEVLKAAEQNISKKGKSLFGTGIEIVEGHHEKWDGSGYPYGKKGNDIPLSARIVAVADVFDALTSKRPYKQAFSFEESLHIIEEGSGKHFDPEIVEIFIKNRRRIEDIYHGFHIEEKIDKAV
jgi:HD-GYP domain-containing protein (c-di-GMP phosphodiesterase class II)